MTQKNTDPEIHLEEKAFPESYSISLTVTTPRPFRSFLRLLHCCSGKCRSAARIFRRHLRPPSTRYPLLDARYFGCGFAAPRHFAANIPNYSQRRTRPFLTTTALFAVVLVIQSALSRAAEDSANAPALPGRGLSQHPFLYTGEWDHRKSNQTIFVVRDGKIAWFHSIPSKDADGVLSELGDATMLSNGNILFCRKVGASEITPDKKIVWDYPAPKGTEIHSVQAIGLDRVLLVENGDPARLLVIEKATGKIIKELNLPVPNPQKPHLQFRRVRLTVDNTFLAAHLDAHKVVEYDQTGKEIWSYATPAPWCAVRLKNGNTLISSYPNFVVEVNKAGKVVWQFSGQDIPTIPCFIFQEVSRLANGNTVICNWCPGDLKDPAQWPGTVQVLEVSPDKKVVWALSEWRGATDLGPASSIQLLDEPGVAENGELQR